MPKKKKVVRRKKEKKKRKRRKIDFFSFDEDDLRQKNCKKSFFSLVIDAAAQWRDESSDHACATH
jgi:hypothetical protein